MSKYLDRNKFATEKCYLAHKALVNWRINHEVSNKGYHIQIQIQHNFYPSKRGYYNSVSNKRCTYPQFNNVNELLKFLGNNTK